MNLDAEKQTILNELAVTRPEDVLCRFVEQNAAPLLNTLRLYLKRAQIIRPNDLQEAAKELLNEVLVEALQHANRFDLLRSPMAWLLGIAANLIRRKKDAAIKRQQREVLFCETYREANSDASDEEIWAGLARLALVNPLREIEGDDEARRMLSLVSETDRRILQCCIIEQMDYEAAAVEFDCKAGTVRVRLHRAIKRLREAVIAAQNQQGGERNG